MAKIVILTSRFPYPVEKGDKLRIFNFIRELSQWHQLHLICIQDRILEDKDYEIMEKYCHTTHVFKYPLYKRICNLFINIFKSLPFQVQYFTDSAIAKLIKSRINTIYPDILFCHLIRMAAYTDFYQGTKFIDFMDAFSNICLKEKNKKSGLSRLLLGIEHKRLRKYEQKNAKLFDELFVISSQDSKALALQQHIKILPNGLDFSLYFPQKTEIRADILFAGNMGYKPNIDAAIFLVERIVPEYFKRYNILLNVRIAGARPSRSVRLLSGKSVTVTGWVDNMNLEYNSAKILVAPIFTGAGMQNKILEALACGIPTLTTASVKKGISLNQDNPIISAESAAQFSENIYKLLNDNLLYSSIRKKGITFVSQHFSWEKSAHIINDCINRQT